jgi:preprotein translocase subunit SecF
MQILRNPNYDFLGKTKILLVVSTTLILLGIAYIATQGVRYGVEFSGGTQLIARFQNRPEVEKVRAAVDKVVAGATIQTYDDPSKNQVLIRLPHVGGADAELSSAAQAVLQSLKDNYSGNSVVESSTEIVGPVVGAELRRKAVQITIFGLLCQLIYIAFRFGGAMWGTAATIAVFHDVLITLA